VKKSSPDAKRKGLNLKLVPTTLNYEKKRIQTSERSSCDETTLNSDEKTAESTANKKAEI